MPATEWGWLITPAELTSWLVADTPEVLAVNKPGGVVCHPSKHGPWSSLVGACREYLGLPQLHMPSRLDRETSGVVIFAKQRATASRLQKAIQERRVCKTYYAVLAGLLDSARVVTAPLGRDQRSAFYNRQWVTETGQAATTEFVPLAQAGGYTLARIHPLTGRLHQIRVHASYIGHSVAGDKLYGPDESLMFEFLANGWSARLAAALPFRRQALHAAKISFSTDTGEETFAAPLTPDFAIFCEQLGLFTPDAAASCCSPR